jgi:hypothetical protein
MSWIFKELRNFAKKPLEEEQDFMDWLVFGNRAHKPKKMTPEAIEKAVSMANDEISRTIKTTQTIDDIKDIIKNEELSPAPKPFIPPAPPLPISPEEKQFVPFIPPAPPLPISPEEKQFVPFIPPAPPLPQKELIPKPSPGSVIYQKPEPKENENDKFLESIRKGTTLKPVKKPEIKIKKSFLDELKEAPKLTKKEIKIIQKEVKKAEPSFNDLIKANKKFQALSRNVETKNEDNDIDDFAGWGIKKQKIKRVKKKQQKYYYY